MQTRPQAPQPIFLGLESEKAENLFYILISFLELAMNEIDLLGT